jgi:hypothetical protein
LAAHMKTRRSDGGGCRGKEFSSCEHRLSRFVLLVLI